MSAGGLEILNLHAQGGMAEVYRARAVDETGRSWFYAVKRMLPELLSEPEMMRMFIEEQRVAACLMHENIVRVYDVAQADVGSDADTFIVMEFLEGRDLSEVIEAADKRGKPLAVWFCIHVAREVLKALHYATTQAKDKSGRILGLIHRDISPHNIFVCADGQVKLTDFGVARVETAEVRTKAGVIKGKFGYMSPEQLIAGQLDFRSDLYNVGIQLYESLTSKRLFWGETATQFIAAMMQNIVPPLDKKLLVPSDLEALMKKALAKKREDRPASPAQFELALGAIADKYGLACTRAHISGEMMELFPVLAEPESPEPLPPPPPTAPEPPPIERAPPPRTSSHAPVSLASPPAQPAQARAPTKARVLTFVGAAAKPHPPSTDGSPVFTVTRAAHDADTNVTSGMPERRPAQKPPTGRADAPSPGRPQATGARAAPLPAPPQQPAPRQPSSVAAAAPRQPTASQPSQPRQPMASQPSHAAPGQPAPARQPSGVAARPPAQPPAQPQPQAKPSPRPVTAPRAAPPAQPEPDELIPTLLEQRPSLAELGLDEAMNAHGFDGPDAAQTEPTRPPAFIADPPSSTAPARDGFQPGVARYDDSDLEDDIDANAPTAETKRPPAAQLRPAPDPAVSATGPQVPASSSLPTPLGKHRVSTGSRRVISLADDEGKNKKR